MLKVKNSSTSKVMLFSTVGYLSMIGQVDDYLANYNISKQQHTRVTFLPDVFFLRARFELLATRLP